MSLRDDLPTPSEIEAVILAIYQSIRPNASASRMADLWLNSKIWAKLMFRVHRTFARAVDALFPTTAFDEHLDDWLALLGLSDGLGGYGRIQVRGSGPIADALRVTATGATVDIDGYQLTATNGTIYEIDESYAFGGAGYADLQVVAISKGANTNLEILDTLTFSSPPANIVAAAVLVKDLTGGADRETNPGGRARLRGRTQRPVLPGNVSHWANVIESVSPGALKAFVWPGRENQPYGFGTTDYCAIKLGEHGYDRLIFTVDAIYAAITAAVAATMPGLMMYNSRNLNQNPDFGDIEITITLGDGATSDQKCDWDAESLKTTVLGSTVDVKTIDALDNICAPTVTNGLEVGHRVVIRGAEAVVATVNVGADAKKFTVVEWPERWGTLDDEIALYHICAGGGFIGSVEDEAMGVESSGIMGALTNYCDTIGPCKGSYSGSAQIPGWEDSWRVTAIKSVATQVGDGNIIEVTINDIDGGVVDKTPTDTVTGTVNIMCLDDCAVWQVWV